MSKLTAFQVASKDITKSLKRDGAISYNPHLDEVWTVTPNQLNCVEVKDLNKLVLE